MIHPLATLSVASVLLPMRTVAGPMRSAAPHMDSLMLANFLLALAAIVCCKEQRQSNAFVLGLALSTAGIAVLGFLHGAWAPATIVGLWSAVSFRHWARDRHIRHVVARWTGLGLAVSLSGWQRESRISRLFGADASDFKN